MKILLCVNRFSDFAGFFSRLSESTTSPIPFPDPQSSIYTCSFHYLQHEIDLCELGYGTFQTTFKLTKVLTQKKYHLALRASLCNAYRPDLAVGDIVNVIKDKPGDFGSMTESGLKDLYDLGLTNSEDFPHFKGAFINMNNSYMNVMMPYKKVVSVTVNQYADHTGFAARKEKYKADIETGDGLGFVYPCMYERQPFYQLCVVERNLQTREYDAEKALEILNNTIFDVLQKI